MVPGQAHFRSSEQVGDPTDSDEEAYSSGDYDADGGTIVASTSKAARLAQDEKSSAEMAKYSDEDDDDDNDYEDDDDFHATGSLRQSGKDDAKQIKMSLESDQEADENEFEQIKDEDYVEEDDEQDSNEHD